MRWSHQPTVLLVAAGAALALVACGGTGGASSGGSSSGSSATPKMTTPTPASAAVVKTATATVGGKSETILTNAQGMTLYYYTPDKASSVTCTGACAALWPPLSATSGTKVTVPGASGTFGTASNPSGGSVVTYNGWPLYTYVKDKAPGDVTGQGVKGVWFVATPGLTSSGNGASPTPSSGY